MDKNKIELIDNNKILEIKTGSWLYGLNTPSSDIDYQGIFLPDKKHILGFNRIEEIDLSIKNKLENGKNSKDAIDRKFYEFRKYVKLAMENNPNILEMIFVNKENIIFCNEVGRELLSIAEMFPHKGLKERFCGYAISQKKKMIVKRDNYLQLESAQNFLQKLIENNEEKLILPQCDRYSEFNEIFKIKKQTDNHYKIGDRGIIKNQTVKRASQEITKIIGQSTNRKELIKDKGYDFKFGHHLIRLLLEGIELLETGRINFPLQNKKELLEIKTGKWSLDEVLNYADDLEDKINGTKQKSDLPNKPRYKEIENFTIKILEKWLSIK